VFLMQALCFALFACAFNLLLGYVGLLSIIAFSTDAFKRRENPSQSSSLSSNCRSAEPGVPSLLC